MKILIFYLILLFVQPLSFSQKANVNNTRSDPVLVTKVDSLAVVDSSLFKSGKNISDKNPLELNPPSILDIISVGKIIWSIIFVVVGFYIIRLLTKVLDLFAEKSISYRITFKGLIPIIRITGWIVIIYILIAGIFKPPISTVIAVTASIGIAVGFAAQDILKNIFGGVMILFDRPFQVGDKIQVGDYYGEVIKIGLRSTRVVTPDDSTVTIPNGEIMNKSVSNTNFGEPYCQVVAEIYLPINVDTNKVREIAIEAAQVSRYIFLNKPITVLFFNEVKEERAYLKMRLKAYVMDIRFEFNFKSDMTEIVMRELLNQKIISPNDFY